MFEMIMDSGQRFFAGTLFQDNKKVAQQLAIGVGIGAVALVVVAQFAPVWIAALVGGAVTGFLQPILFKDLKYA